MINTKRMTVLDNSHRITVTNLLTPNQADGTDTLGDTTGFTAIGGTPATISSSTDRAYRGSRSLKVVTPGAGINEGERVGITSIVGGVYTSSARVWCPTGTTIRLTLGLTVIDIIGNNDWQEATATFTATATTTYSYVYTKTKSAVTFYVDSLMVETGDTAHDWIIGQGSYSFFRSRE